jgi:hypothetical protein
MNLYDHLYEFYEHVGTLKTLFTHTNGIAKKKIKWDTFSPMLIKEV